MKGTLTYTAPINDDEPALFGSFDVPSQEPLIDRITVAAEDGPPRVEIILEFPNVASEAIARALAGPEVHRILGRVSFHLGASLLNASCKATLEPSNPGEPGFASVEFDLISRGYIARPLTEADRQDLQTFLGSAPSQNDGRYDEVRNVLKYRDAVQKFMFLYAILLRHKGGQDGSQKNADIFIRHVQPGVALRKTSKRDKHHDETIYTKLRNELGHTDSGRPLEDTRAEMEANLPGLIDVVKRAMV